MSLSPESDREEQVRGIFLGALEIDDPTEREAWVAERCGSSEELRARVSELLCATEDDDDGFLESAGEARREAAEQELEPMPGPGTIVGYIGDYELLEEIARGAMGVVYRARQISLNRQVAVKMIRGSILASEGDVQRFRVEAKAAGSLNHPNIVPIYEISEFEGQSYFSMQLIEGGTLADHMASVSRSIDSAVQLMLVIARAISAAHRRGVLHRDIKPGNVLLDEEGMPHITDFGLAKQMGSESDLTLSGQIMGTPYYMAPEQASGEKGNASTAMDVYSLGAVLFEMLTGRPPFQSDSVIEILQLVQEEEPPRPHSLNEKIDRDLETVVLKCLEKEPDDRYASAADFADDLERWQRGEPIYARPVPPAERAIKWMRRKPLYAGFIAVAALLVLLLTVGGPLIGYRQNRLLVQTEKAETEYRLELANSLESVAPGGIPFLIDALQRKETPEIRRLLKERLQSDLDVNSRTRIAIALAVFGDPEWSILTGGITELQSEEGPNLALAFAAHPKESVIRLRKKFNASEVQQERTRIAIQLLCLGDTELAANQLSLGPSIADRVEFINEFKKWHGDLSTITTILESVVDPDFQSGLCLAAGGVSHDRFPPDQLSRLLGVLNSLYVEAPDSGLHASAEWAIRQLGGQPAEIEGQTDPDEDRDWYVNHFGMTMVRIRPGVFFPNDYVRAESGEFLQNHMIGVTEEYFLSWGNITEDQVKEAYQRGRELGVLETDRLPPMREKSLPLACIPWINTFVFCNCISAIEGLTPVYTVRYPHVEFDPQADGYRIPSEAEWELAARAGTVTRYITGPTSEFLPDYAHIFSERHSAARNSRPNPLGLFDMTGNSWEITFGSGYPRWDGQFLNPVGPVGEEFAARGGAAEGGVFHCHGSSKMPGGATRPNQRLAVRLARGIPGDFTGNPTVEEIRSLFPSSLTKNQRATVASVLARDGKWEEASEVWDRLIHEFPNEGRSASEAGQRSAQWANWGLAGHYLFEAAKQRDAISDEHVRAAAAYLQAEDTEGYLKVRSQALSLPLEPLNFTQLESLFRIALLRPPYEFLKSDGHADAYNRSLDSHGRKIRELSKLTNAWIALRLEDADTTLAWMEEIEASISPSFEANIWSIKAMALLRKNEIESAQELIRKAGERVDAQLKPPYQGRWEDWLIANQLRKEAENLLQEKLRRE